MDYKASQIIDIECHTIIQLDSNYISHIRLSVYSIISLLLDSENNELAYLLKGNLFYHLSSPLKDWANLFAGTPFENSNLQIENIYGKDIAKAVNHIRENIELTILFGNPLNLALQEYLSDSGIDQETKIYCKRRYHSDFSNALKDFSCTNRDSDYITSVSEYKESKLFENLVIVGPIRTDSWGAAPSYLFRNKKWKTLTQFIWRGVENDYSVFHDPLIKIRSILQPNLIKENIAEHNIQKKSFITNHFKNNETINSAVNMVFDEFEKLKVLTIDKLPVVALILKNEEAILFKPNKKIFILDNIGTDYFTLRHCTVTSNLNECLNESYFLEANYEQLDSESNRKFESRYEDIWKDILGEQDSDELIGQLKAYGIKLKNLEDRVFSWMECSKDIVHAPAEKQNFLILLKTLQQGITSRLNIENSAFDVWVDGAWKEVLMSRGEAITEGKNKHEQYDEVINDVLLEYIEDIQKLHLPNKSFIYEFKSSDLNVSITFYPIKNIELGYEAPSAIISKVLPIKQLEIYK
jgi:hypothetical protein